jgi:Raf kinase inhibitor-like YbhB/YbcL family protein
MMLTGTVTPGFVLQSSAFQDNATLPTEFTCAGAQTSPPLSWSGAPATTRAFTLVEQDMDVPPPNGPVVHWLIYNIPATVTSLAPGQPQVDALPIGAMQGVNAQRSLGYIGSCPPPGAAPHHYVFQLFAMDAPVTVKAQPTIVDFQPALQGHVIAQTQLRATFGRGVIRPFRFGMQAARVRHPAEWQALARSAEAAGYSSFLIPDHLGRMATFPALMSAAAVTNTIKLATYVLNQDWRPPAILAQEAASVQLLTGGRLELGIGAGWAKHEYAQVGLQYDSPRVRVDRLDEYLQVVKGILNATAPFSFDGRFFKIDRFSPQPGYAPPPPILVGGGSPRILATSGRLADIISVSTRASPDGRVDMPNIRLADVENKVRAIKEAAGSRFDQIELNMTVRDVRVTNDRRAAAQALIDEWAALPNRHANVEHVTVDDVLDSPPEAIGTVQQIIEQFEAARERWGFAYLEVSSTDAEDIAPIMAALVGR